MITPEIERRVYGKTLTIYTLTEQLNNNVVLSGAKRRSIFSEGGTPYFGPNHGHVIYGQPLRYVPEYSIKL